MPDNFSDKIWQFSFKIFPRYSKRRSFFKIFVNIFNIIRIILTPSSKIKKEINGAAKTLIFIDRHVPFYDRDAGSRSVFQYLSYFASFGFNVKFIGHDFLKHKEYSAALEKLGIDVLYGSYYYFNLKKWIKKNEAHIDYVFLSRPNIAYKYIDYFRQQTKAKVFYLGHDLHYLRESREYNITGVKAKLRESEKWKKIELALIEKSDMSYYVSSHEINIIKKINPLFNCKIIPINIFQAFLKTDYKYNERNNLLFVGGFGHSPNADAVLWFAKEILPVVIKSIPEIILNVIGSNPVKEIIDLECDNIKVLGYQNDDSLDKYYKSCRLCVVPLRFGAGIKGKVTEALYKQIPVITTSIGAEGLPDLENCLEIADDPLEFANKIISIYSNNDILKKLSENGYNYIIKHFSNERMDKLIQEDFYFEREQKCK